MEGVLKARRFALNNSIIGARELVKELKTTTVWQEKYGFAWKGNTEEIKINTMLKHLSTALKGQDAYGKEVDYQSNQRGSNFAKNKLDKIANPGKVQGLAEREYRNLKTDANRFIKEG